MKKSPFAVMAFVLLGAALLVAWRGEYCSESAVCMIMEQEGSRVKVIFQNRLPMENQVTTATFEVSPALENLKCADAFPLTRVVSGKEPALVTVLDIVDPSGHWNSNLRFNWQYGSPPAGREQEIVCRLPFARGKRFRAGQAFNGKISHYNETRYAVDFLMPVGTPVHAARDGIVIATENRQEEGKLEPAYTTKSNYVLMQHDDGSVDRYYHLVKGGVKVGVGQEVKAGDLIGLSGNSGYSDVPHLHFEVSRPVDGKSKKTVPVVFITDYAERDIPVEGRVYCDSGLASKSALPVCAEDVVLCRSVKDLKPVDIIDTISTNESASIYIPISVPGVHSIRVLMYRERERQKANSASWKTGKTWWYTSFPVEGKNLGGRKGRWKAEIEVNSQPVKTLEFNVR